MDADLEQIFSNINKKIDSQNTDATCRNLGELQMSVIHHIEFVGQHMAPLLTYVTQAFRDCRVEFVNKMTDEDFIKFARSLEPGLFEPSLDEDCDEEGIPAYSGKESKALLNANFVREGDRQLFVDRVGMKLVALVTVSPAVVENIAEMFERLAVEKRDEIIQSYLVATKKMAVPQMRSMRIPRH